MADELKTIKFQMMLSESEAAQIDDWGFARRIRSRAEVIRRLCQMAIQADPLIADVASTSYELMDVHQGSMTGADPEASRQELWLRYVDLYFSAAQLGSIWLHAGKGEAPSGVAEALEITRHSLITIQKSLLNESPDGARRYKRYLQKKSEKSPLTTLQRQQLDALADE